MQSQIQRMNGPINNVNDQVIGQQPAFGSSTTISKVSGQLGKIIELDDSTVIYNATTGIVYGGLFQYVRLAAAAGVPALGQILFWDISVADNLFQVTTLESGSVPGAQIVAGINLNPALTVGYYTYIQVWGPTFVKFRAALSQVPAGVGVAVYAAAAGAGADNGLADVINSADPADFSDVGLMQNRYLGTAKELPTNGGTKLVYVNPHNRRG